MITVSTISGDNRILVGTDYCGRAAMCLLNHNWTRVRIALRLCSDYSGVDINPANLFVGLSAGASLFQSPVVPPNPAHGILFNLTGNSTTWSHQTPPNRYLRLFCAGQGYVNGVQPSGYGSAGDIEVGTHYIGATDANRTALFCDFIRATPGAATWTMDYFRNAQIACTDVDQTTFEAQSIVLAPTITDHDWASGVAGGGGSAGAIPVSEATNGYFTHVNIAWNNAAPLIKISDLRVIVLTTL